MDIPIPRPKPDQLSADDLMLVVTYRAEFLVTRQFSEEIKQFVYRVVETYSEEAINQLSRALNKSRRVY